ncbi:asialoglycoprotein receptor 2-like [Lissotriton helveticus]
MEPDVTYAEVKFRDGAKIKAEIKTDAKTDSQAQAVKKTSPKILIVLLLVILILLAGLCVLITLYFQASSRVPELEKQMAQLERNHTKVLKYIGCKNRTDQNCSELFYRACPTDWLPYNGKCYFFSQNTLTWDGSRSKCLTSQADLVIINDRMEQIFIGNTTKTEVHWIGLTDKDQEDAWKWVNGLNLQTKEFWACTQPDNAGEAEHCATVGSFTQCGGASSRWNDARCENKEKFICEKEAEDRKMDFTP